MGRVVRVEPCRSLASRSMLAEGEPAVSRRTFLAGTAAGGLALLAPARPVAAQVTPPMLGARELDAFGELVGVLREAHDGRFHATDPGRARQVLARWYPHQEPGVQRHATHVLGALAADGVPDYATLAQPARPAGSADAARAATVSAAVALAGLLLEPDVGSACAPTLVCP